MLLITYGSHETSLDQFWSTLGPAGCRWSQWRTGGTENTLGLLSHSLSLSIYIYIICIRYTPVYQIWLVLFSTYCTYIYIYIYIYILCNIYIYTYIHMYVYVYVYVHVCVNVNVYVYVYVYVYCIQSICICIYFHGNDAPRVVSEF